jgi:trk system potassium uptake protein TrkH
VDLIISGPSTTDTYLLCTAGFDLVLGIIFVALLIHDHRLTTQSLIPTVIYLGLIGVSSASWYSPDISFTTTFIWLRILRGCLILHVLAEHIQDLHQYDMYENITHRYSKSPALVFLLSFAVVIFVGTILLAQSAFTTSGDATPILDAFFTATSATCVTGLTTLDTGTHWNLGGQIVVLVLIQVGALGIMSLVSVCFLLLKERMALTDEQIVGRSLSASSRTMAPMKATVRRVVLWAVTFEVLGFCLLARLWPTESEPAYWDALFHSISAFCNAGFSLESSSLMNFGKNPLILTVIMTLIIMGGLGVTVLINMGQQCVSRWRGKRKYVLSLQTRIVLLSTLSLLVLGSFSFAITEWRGVLRDMEPGEGVFFCLFQATTSRTAGFNTVDIDSLSDASLVTTMALMFIGGSPASTAGGIKTTTFFLLLLAIWGILKNREEPQIFGRTIPRANLYRATAIFTLGLGILLLFSILILAIEQKNPACSFRSIVFEVFSAFGTVGLSAGITAKLSGLSKFLVCILMFLGRIGPITLAVALTTGEAPRSRTFPYEGVGVG